MPALASAPRLRRGLLPLAHRVPLQCQAVFQVAGVQRITKRTKLKCF